MTAKKKRLLIVDASVVRSAGETEHPVSSSCRKCLEAILRICHRVAVTPAIKDEWDRHMSKFARKWRRSMAARRKPLEPVSPACVPINISAYDSAAQKQIEKDFHLLEAALSADSIIITRDDALRSALEKHSDGIRLLKSVKMINPVLNDVKSLEEL